eukprot:UN03813
MKNNYNDDSVIDINDTPDQQHMIREKLVVIRPPDTGAVFDEFITNLQYVNFNTCNRF